MPIYDFQCRRCSRIFEERRPVGTTKTVCDCGSLADKQFNTQVQFRVPEGFRTVNRSDVCAVKGTDWHPRTWPAAKVGAGRRAQDAGGNSPAPRVLRPASERSDP